MSDQPQSKSPKRREAVNQKRAGWRVFLRDTVVIVLAALAISFVVKTFFVRTYYIPSASMSSTLVQNDRVIVNALVPAVMPIERGDIVVFRDPANWMGRMSGETGSSAVGPVGVFLSIFGLGPNNNDDLIKRVIGLPGDRVVCCDSEGRLAVNGTALEEPYITVPTGLIDASPAQFDVTVPAGTLWVLGDNRYNSGDSAYHRNDSSGGFVPVENVAGRAFALSWPIDRWTLLGSGDATTGRLDE